LEEEFPYYEWSFREKKGRKIKSEKYWRKK